MEKRYWVIAPYSSEKSEFDKIWEYDVKNETIAIGWAKLGNVSKMNEEKLKTKIKEVYPKKTTSHTFNSIWKFYHEVGIGDVIIARKGRKKIIGIGEVTKTAFYDKKKGKERSFKKDKLFPNFISVKWKQKGEINFENLVFSMTTIYEIPKEKYKFLIEGKKPGEGEPESEEQKEFILEKYLEDFIVSNFDRIFKNKLKLYKEKEGNGQQYPTDIGYIDILAKEPATNSYVVIELKKGRGSDKVVGQVLRYMGWVMENLAQKKEKVKGLIICRKKDEKLNFALKPIQNSNIKVKLYKVDFQLIE